MMLRFYDDGLSRDRQAQLYNFLSGPGWEYGAYSTPETRSSCYWYKHFGGFLGNETLDADKLPPVIGLFWTALTQEIFKGHTLVRCYANGYPYGAEGRGAYRHQSRCARRSILHRSLLSAPAMGCRLGWRDAVFQRG